MPKGFSLMRLRRSFMQRTNDWFSINRFKQHHLATLSNPTPKVLEQQELQRTLAGEEEQSEATGSPR